MQQAVVARYEEQFTAFIDFLGFSEASGSISDIDRLNILNLLLSLSTLRGEFEVQSEMVHSGRRYQIKPAITTFSDHIVVSFPLEQVYAGTGSNERSSAFVLMHHFNELLSRIAAAALRIGFLIRGGATIGKLYHSQGVVFGEAMVEAFQIESRTSVYPRVVLSSKITSRPAWIEQKPFVMQGDDGLYQFDYFKTLVFSAATPGDTFLADAKTWFSQVVGIIERNLRTLETQGKLNELAKWSWFAREFHSGLERLNPMVLESFGLSLDAISFGKSKR
jgi:hypothetical protein